MPPAAETPAVTPTAAASLSGKLPTETDFWETNEQLRHVERVLQAVQRSWETDTAPPDFDAPTDDRQLRFDPAETGKPRASFRAAGSSAAPKARRSPARQHGQRLLRIDSATKHGQSVAPRSYPMVASLLAWLAWAAGVTAFTCGGVLCGWGWYEGRDELWNLGLPILLVGQLGLLAGLVLRLDMLRHRNRQTESQLEAVDERLMSLSRRIKRK